MISNEDKRETETVDELRRTSCCSGCPATRHFFRSSKPMLFMWPSHFSKATERVYKQTRMALQWFPMTS